MALLLVEIAVAVPAAARVCSAQTPEGFIARSLQEARRRASRVPADIDLPAIFGEVAERGGLNDTDFVFRVAGDLEFLIENR